MEYASFAIFGGLSLTTYNYIPMTPDAALLKAFITYSKPIVYMEWQENIPACVFKKKK